MTVGKILASKVLIVRPDGPAAFGMTPAQRLERLAVRGGLKTTDHSGEADIIIRGDHIYGAGLFNEIPGAAPGTVLVDGSGRALAGSLLAAWFRYSSTRERAQ